VTEPQRTGLPARIVRTGDHIAPFRAAFERTATRLLGSVDRTAPVLGASPRDYGSDSRVETAGQQACSNGSSNQREDE
jgi:hypothetical protein